MGLRDYVETKQPFVFKTFSHALENEHLAHAYLLLGESGIPLKEMAIYLAKSLLCDHPSPLADEICPICLRIEKNEYPDFAFFDGSDASIKKEQISELVTSFQNTALERKGRKVYVVHLVENMTQEAVNALLKFLEEPPSNSYAILTTENQERVLPTILSRCQSIRTMLLPREEVVRAAYEEGINHFDAELYSHFYNETSVLKEKVVSDEISANSRLFQEAIIAFKEDEMGARFTFEKNIIPFLNKKPALRLFLDCLVVLFEDIARMESFSPIHLISIEEDLADLAKVFPNASLALGDILSLRGEAEGNINSGLLLTHLLFVLYHRKKSNS